MLDDTRAHARTWARVVALADAPGNVGLAYPFPGATDARIVAVSFKLVAAAGGGARSPVLTLVDGSGVVVAAVASPFTVAATNTSRFTFGAGLQQFGANNAANIGGPFVVGWLPGNLTLAVSFVNGAAGDVVSDARLVLDQRAVTSR